MNDESKGQGLQPQDCARELRLSDVQWDSDGTTLVWREERSDRGVLVCQRVSQSAPYDLTGDLSVRARVGYGGGEFCVGGGYVYFAAGGKLYRQSLTNGTAQAITPAWGESASPCIWPGGEFLVYVHSVDGTDALAIVDAQGQGWPARLSGGHDFYMQPCWHLGGMQLAWIAWDHPNMPWQGTALYLASLEESRPLPIMASSQVIDGDPTGEVAIFQPAFSPDGRYLSYVSDESGWFNLYLYDLDRHSKDVLLSEEAEHGVPAWVQGLRTYGWTADSSSLFLIRSKSGYSSVVKVEVASRRVQELQTLISYSNHRQISVSPKGETLGLIASSPRTPQSILSASSEGPPCVYRRSSSKTVPEPSLSVPESLQWSTGTSKGHCYGLYYPAAPDRFGELPPAILKIHGGPTSHFSAEYQLDAQYWASRGFAVLELNYRGSSGYGREYAAQLKGKWGVIDVQDVYSAAEYLGGQGLANPNRLVVLGGSAGGFTVLLSLIHYPGIFKAGVCRYAVSNLFTLASGTHKFEMHYLDWLVGTLPEQAELYRQRSPVYSAERIIDPLAVFQGEDDKVVPREQSDQIVDSLRSRGIPHIYRVYPGEGHGWKKQETIEDYYRTLEDFLRRYV
ncbi:MAG: S9 family peptidase [Acidobacteriota bacterium]